MPHSVSEFIRFYNSPFSYWCNKTNKLVNDILVLEPNNVDGLFFSGFAAYNKGEKNKAITYWDLLLKQLPKDSLMSKEINKRIKLLQD